MGKGISKPLEKVGRTLTTPFRKIAEHTPQNKRQNAATRELSEHRTKVENAQLGAPDMSTRLKIQNMGSAIYNGKQYLKHPNSTYYNAHVAGDLLRRANADADFLGSYAKNNEAAQSLLDEFNSVYSQFRNQRKL